MDEIVGVGDIPAERVGLPGILVTRVVKKTVEPDAFLTGKVVVSADRKKTTVTLESFDKDNPARLNTLGTFVVNTDRFVLRDVTLIGSAP